MSDKDKQKKEDKENKQEPVILAKDEFDNLQAMAAVGREYNEKLLRLHADFENTKKRFERQSQEFAQFANCGIILELLNILDDLGRAVTAAEKKQEDFPAFLKGVEMILSHLHDLLKKNGLSVVEAKGKKFDPNTHEALMQVDSPEEDGTVLEELQKGYLLYDKVIRTSKVKVAKQTENKKEVINKEEDKEYKEE
ncbi:MAG: nucleotide exchange factor GrpE [Candidatus Gygaella obscura]|nr:nucleotide exchange factor GrpE [Candidatus Gygaella obscura]